MREQCQGSLTDTIPKNNIEDLHSANLIEDSIKIQAKKKAEPCLKKTT